MIGDNVKNFERKSLTQDGLARKADIPYTTLTKLESKIAEALDVSVEELIE